MSLFSETKGFFCSLCNKRSLKDATMKTEYFADIISWKQRANQQKKKKKIQGNVFLLNYKPFNYIKDSQTVNPWLILGHFVGYLTHFHDWFGKTQYVLCFFRVEKGKNRWQSPGIHIFQVGISVPLFSSCLCSHPIWLSCNISLSPMLMVAQTWILMIAPPPLQCLSHQGKSCKLVFDFFKWKRGS